jgi:hypothetical protein
MMQSHGEWRFSFDRSGCMPSLALLVSRCRKDAFITCFGSVDLVRLVVAGGQVLVLLLASRHLSPVPGVMPS